MIEDEINKNYNVFVIACLNNIGFLREIRYVMQPLQNPLLCSSNSLIPLKAQQK
jgi:hypothetical protein